MRKLTAFIGLFLTAAAVFAETCPAQADLAKVKAAQRILFLGNSITLHGSAPKIGWTNVWGMAASAKEKDYAHVVAKGFAARTGHEPKTLILNIADFERNYKTFDSKQSLKKALDFKADIVIFAIGENVPAIKKEEDVQAFEKGFRDIIANLREQAQPVILIRSPFWRNAVQDRAQRKVCEDVGGIFVDAGSLGDDPTNKTIGLFKHQGVANHPGDKGMKALADLILKALFNEKDSPKK